MARSLLLQWRLGLLLTITPLATGCIGLSFPLGEAGAGAPAVTGAIEPASWPPQPLPAGIERSDAAALAEAARRALAAGGSPPAAQWQNPETGSTGTLEPLGRASQEEGHGTCRTYLSTVTSIRGVHRYTCRACRAADGTVSVHSIAPGPFQTARSAGI